MEQYYVEGLIRRNHKNAGAGAGAGALAEAVAVAVWANSPEEAQREASRKLGRVRWLEGPTITRVSEEQRMRAMGAPELFASDRLNLVERKKR